MKAVAQQADEDAAGHAGRVEQADHEGAGRGVQVDGAGVGGEVGGREARDSSMLPGCSIQKDSSFNKDNESRCGEVELGGGMRGRRE